MAFVSPRKILNPYGGFDIFGNRIVYEKECSFCKKTKLISEFYSVSGRDAPRNCCIPCYKGTNGRVNFGNPDPKPKTVSIFEFLEPEKPIVKELTVSEISNLLGYKVKIV